MLADARQRTLDLVSDLSDEQLMVPETDTVNPPIWEIGHVAWFHERWELRYLRGEASGHPHPEEFGAAASVSHHSRWELPLPSRAATLQYMQDAMDKALDRLPDRDL